MGCLKYVVNDKIVENQISVFSLSLIIGNGISLLQPPPGAAASSLQIKNIKLNKKKVDPLSYLKYTHSMVFIHKLQIV